MAKRYYLADMTIRGHRNKSQERWAVLEAYDQTIDGTIMLRPIPEEHGHGTFARAGARARELEERYVPGGEHA